MQLKSKTALITGGTDGIGKELVLQFAANNYNILTIGRSASKIKTLKNLLDKNPQNKSLIVQGDLSKENSLNNFISEIKKEYDTIDILINNAVLQINNSLLEDSSLDSIKEMIEVHTIAPLKLYQEFYPQMKARSSGMIINIISIVVYNYLKETYGPYTISKFAEFGLGRMMVKEASKNNIKIINVILGGVDSNIREARRNEYLKPSDVAETIFKLTLMPEDIFIPEIHIYPKVQLS